MALDVDLEIVAMIQEPDLSSHRESRSMPNEHQQLLPEHTLPQAVVGLKK
ncbi:MAG: hypothetical protein KDA89_16800 [Planctomycetaceae bacterium]|nr:hypothetical protein [Planctomycetaceae bacterium]